LEISWIAAGYFAEAAILAVIKDQGPCPKKFFVFSKQGPQLPLPAIRALPTVHAEQDL
jgi:hypothetical protein